MPNEPKSVLILIGDEKEFKIRKRYWDSLYDPESNIKITCLVVKDFLIKEDEDSRYDCIIISGHAGFGDDLTRESRTGHVFGLGEDGAIPTVTLAQYCSSFSKKILISGCHAGTVMKDLQSNPVDADVVALGGSKYTTIIYNPYTLEIAKKFIQNETNELYEFASTHFINTIQIQQDESITKLGPVKIVASESNDSLPSIKRTLYTASTKLTDPLMPKTDHWWAPVGDQVISIEDLSPTVKNQLLAIAVTKEKTKDVSFWLSQGASPDTELNFTGITPLGYAISYTDNLEIIENLLKEKANPNKAEADGITPLFRATEKGNPKVVKALVEAGADISRVNSKGITPLFQAAQRGYTAAVEVLLTAGAKPDIADQNGVTPLFLAIEAKREKMIEVLLAKGANPNLARLDGLTPLLRAIPIGPLKVVQALLSAGADPDKAGADGTTPLHLASMGGHLSPIKALLDAGADLDKANNDGMTSLHIAVLWERQSALKALIAAGADLDKADKNGMTPLHMAIMSGDLQSVQVLIAAGADPNKADKNEMTPLSMAAGQDPELVTILEEAIKKATFEKPSKKTELWARGQEASSAKEAYHLIRMKQEPVGGSFFNQNEEKNRKILLKKVRFDMGLERIGSLADNLYEKGSFEQAKNLYSICIQLSNIRNDFIQRRISPQKLMEETQDCLTFPETNPLAQYGQLKALSYTLKVAVLKVCKESSLAEGREILQQNLPSRN